MRIIAQRVKEASVSVDGRLVAAIDAGIMALVGFGQEDGPDYRSSPSYTAMARKLVGLRIFPGTGENAHKFHLSLDEFGGQLLLVHWTPFVHDYPLSGDEVHAAILDPSDGLPLRHLHGERHERYRLDLLERI